MFVQAKKIENFIVPSSRRINIGESVEVSEDYAVGIEYSLSYNETGTPNVVMLKTDDINERLSLYINNCLVYKIEDDGAITQLEAVTYYTSDKPTTGDVNIRGCNVILIFPYVENPAAHSPYYFNSWYKLKISVFS